MPDVTDPPRPDDDEEGAEGVLSAPPDSPAQGVVDEEDPDPPEPQEPG